MYNHEFDKKDLQNFYGMRPYNPHIFRVLPRTSELHTSRYIWEYLSGVSAEELKEAKEGDKLVFILKGEILEQYANVMLHESVFHYFKAFYNYLACRNLYSGEFLHWINITAYYAKFYLARCATTLSGMQSYMVDKNEQFLFIDQVSDVFGKQIKKYKIEVDIDLKNKVGRFVLAYKEKLSSHQEVWKMYNKLPIQNIDLYPLNYSEELRKEYNLPSLTQKRNVENYSFEGYNQLDINVDVNIFRERFDLHRIRNYQDTIYDEYTGEVLLGLCHTYRLLNDLSISGLPIEIDRHKQMIESCMQDNEAKAKLLLLCDEGFKLKRLSSADGDIYFDDMGREL